jgi:hypothetical protein
MAISLKWLLKVALNKDYKHFCIDKVLTSIILCIFTGSVMRISLTAKLSFLCLVSFLFAQPLAIAKNSEFPTRSLEVKALQAAIPVVPSKEVKDKIDALNATGKKEDKLMADVATQLLSNGYRVFSMEKKIFDDKGVTITDIDIETAKVLIEVTVAPDGKAVQIEKYVNNRTVNPSKKAVILYAPSYGSNAAKNIETLGAFPVKDSAQLFQKMSEVGAK